MHLKVLGLQETEHSNKQDRKTSMNMMNPRHFILSGNNTIHVFALIVTR